MRVLILGAYGLIGLEAARLLMREHEVIALGRSRSHGERVLPGARWIGADIAALDTPEKWAPLLEGVDAVVNTAGALQDGARDNLIALQDRAIRALIAACEAKGVSRFVQISAPGADENSDTAFLLTKAVADEALRRSTLDWVILRPGLVWARTASGGTALVRMLAAIPIVQPLMLSNARVQMVDIDDVSTAIAASLSGAIPARTDADLMEPQARTLGEIVDAVRGWHGYAPARWRFEAPRWLGGLVARVADLGGWLGWRSPLRTTSLLSLEQGVTGDGASWRKAGGVEPISFEDSLTRRPAVRQDRVFARSQLVLPLIVLCLAGFWIASGLIGLAHVDAAASVILHVGPMPEIFVIGGALADIALGLALLSRPWARKACFGMIALTGAYLIAGSVLTPQLWADPLGPFVKTLPAAVLAVVCAALLEER